MNKSRLAKLEQTAREKHPADHDFRIVVLAADEVKYFVDGVEVDEVTYNSYPRPEGNMDIKVSWVDNPMSQKISQ
jgi:hypothetical protein